MATEVGALQSVQEKVKERIQATFMDLLPTELFDGMVKQHLDQFIKADLPLLVKAKAQAEFEAYLKAEFNKPEWRERWGGNGQSRTPELMTMVLKECAPQMVDALFSDVAMRIVNHIRNNSIRF